MTAHPIESLLDAVHLALREGRLSDLQALTDALDATTGETAPADGTALQRLHDKALRNARTLEAAARGVKAAQRRLAEIRAVQDGVVAYGPSGTREKRPAPAHLARRF